MNNNENYSIYKDVVNQSDIVAIIGQFIKLKKVGANYVGLCPFHADSKPSLTINPKKKI
jgi:DNA primase